MIRRLMLPLLVLVILPVLSQSQNKPAQDKDRVRVAVLSPEAEAAIDKAHKFLAKHQNPDGSWSPQGQHPVAITALSLMAFMVKGYFPDHEPYGEIMSKGVDYLLQQAKKDEKGYMGTVMYEHGLATLALSEVWGESTRNEEIREALKKAVNVIVNAQTEKGGWGYQPMSNNQQDLSLTVMQVVALASAKEAGILVPDETITRAIGFVKYCHSEEEGGFGYGGPGASFAMTAAAVTSLQMCGKRKSKEVERGLAYLHSLGDDAFSPGEGWFYYGHYYATMGTYLAGEKHYQAWYPKIRNTLVQKQANDGSWEGGVNYQTPMAVLILGVPYRFLPIYQR